MTWVKHDDGFSQNRKVAKLSDKAYRLHFCAIEHCARNLTDGTIMDFELANVLAVAQVKRNALGYVAELVDAELWLTIPHGYSIHGYLEHNPSAAEVKAQRKRNAERQKAHRERTRNDVSNGVTNAVTNGVSHAAPSHPIPLKPKDSRAASVDNSQAQFFVFADRVGLHDLQRLEALKLGPQLLEEAMRVTVVRSPENEAAYFATCVRNLLGAQSSWQSGLPLAQRLETYVRSAGWHYDDVTLTEELLLKGADGETMERLLVVAAEGRLAA